MLSQETIQIVKATAPVVQKHGVVITRAFYQKLLSENPGLNETFNQANQANGHQAQALAAAVHAYAQHIDTPDVLAPGIRHITQKHASLFIRPEQYEIVGKYLLDAFRHILGDAFTKEVHDAWAAAYQELAQTMIDAEEELYREGGDWTDWRDTVIKEKDPESSEITSFTLEPSDQQPLPSYRPGQYISVRVHVPSLGYSQPRQYSLSDRYTSDHYRITVKKDAGVGPEHTTHPGLVSNTLHRLKVGATVQISHPRGDFALDTTEDAGNPLVLISVGVGLTPMISILNTAVAENHGRPVSWIHGYRSASTRAFADHLRSIGDSDQNVRITRFCSRPDEHVELVVDYERPGRVDLDACDNERDLFLSNKATVYFICGPNEFMTKVRVQLKERNVAPDRMRTERFGTGIL